MVVAPLASGCALLLGLEEPSFDGPGAGVIDGGGDGADGSSTCTSDLTTSADNCGRCGRSCLGKACRESMCEAQLLSQGNGSVAYIALDETSVYFSSGNLWLLGRVDKDGGVTSYLLPEGGIKEPTAGLVVDNGSVYASAYSAGGGAGARRIPIDGGPVEKLDSCNTGWSLAVDKTDVYWLTGDCGGDARMKRRAKEELDAAAVVTSQTDPLMFYGYAAFGYQALDDTDVYWATKQHIKALPKDGVANGAPRTVYERPAESTDRFRSLAVGDRLYAMLGGRIIALPKTGGDPIVLAEGFPAKDSHAGLVLAGGDVYFTVPDNGLVARVPMKGGTVDTLAKDQQRPSGLAVDAKYVYWSNAGDGTIWRAAR